MTALTDANERLKAWMIDEALPMWSRRARDHRGGFYEALSPDGAPLTDRTKRFRVQPRMAYALAHAEHLGWTETGRSASDHAWAFTLEAGTDDRTLSSDGEAFSGFVHLLTPTGGAADARRDAYDHAFVLLACAWRMIAFDDSQARDVAARTISFLDTLRQADGSYLEGRPAGLPRRQNPHMHLFEAFMALDRAGLTGARDRAADIRRLFGARFWDGGVLREFFAEDWSLDPEHGQRIEPGHMTEWCWLLDQWQELTGEDESEAIEALYDAALRTGLSEETGWLADEANADGTQRQETTRLWVAGEHTKAVLVRARRGMAGAADEAAAMIDRMLSTYLDAKLGGGWNDRYDANGRVVSEDMPSSTLYHVMSLAAEADRTAAAADAS